jgi:hypothetical protein
MDTLTICASKPGRLQVDYLALRRSLARCGVTVRCVHSAVQSGRSRLDGEAPSLRRNRDRRRPSGVALQSDEALSDVAVMALARAFSSDHDATRPEQVARCGARPRASRPTARREKDRRTRSDLANIRMSLCQHHRSTCRAVGRPCSHGPETDTVGGAPGRQHSTSYMGDTTPALRVSGRRQHARFDAGGRYHDIALRTKWTSVTS